MQRIKEEYVKLQLLSQPSTGLPGEITKEVIANQEATKSLEQQLTPKKKRNAKTLGQLIQDVIVEKVDHRNLNLDVDFMQGKFTSAENFAMGIWHQLKPHIEKDNVLLHSVKLIETPKIYVEYFG